jgi:hypothetical protein
MLLDYRALRFKPAILAVAALDRALMDFHKEHPSLTQHKSLSSFLPRASLARLVKAGLVSIILSFINKLNHICLLFV